MERALERYGVTITISEIKAMARTIREGGGVLLRRGQVVGAGDRYLMRHGDKDLIVIYSQATQQITTMLPRNGGKPHPKRKQATAGPGKNWSHKNARLTRYIPEIDMEDETP